MTESVELGWGIHLQDTGFLRENAAACYVMEDNGEIAIIETGTKDTIPVLLALLAQKKYALEQVKYVIVTHVHLDHAGGVGGLMEKFPNAKLVVHQKGARHMIDPSRLQAGATAVYGAEAFDKTYGNLLAVNANDVESPANETSLSLGKRQLTFIDTPGHARHHFCIYDDKSQGFFTGDTFGLAYPEFTTEQGPFIFPTTTPVQFEPEEMKHSISRLLSYSPKRMFLTHFGMVHNPQKLAELLYIQIDELVNIALQNKERINRVETIADDIMTMLLQKLERHGTQLSLERQRFLLKGDAMLNAQGLDVWLKG